MFRGFRLSALLLAGPLLALAATPAAAQNSVVAPPPPPREGTVGPEQLRDFSLGGANSQRTEPAQPPVERSAPAPAAERAQPAPANERRAPAPVTTTRVVPPPQERPDSRGTTPTATLPQDPAPATSLALPPPTPAPSGSFDFNSPALGTVPAAPADTLAPPIEEDGGAWPWPWLLALAALVGGGLFLWSRRRREEDGIDGSSLAFAGGAPLSEEPQSAAPRPVRPVPQSAPAPAPAPAPANPKGVGIVSTRLRPWLDLDVLVASATLTDAELQLHLQLVVGNSGSVPARQVGVEIVPLNAGPEQDKELADFFGRPDPEPRAAEVIAPLDRAVLQSVVRLPRTAFREYAAGDGRVLVPLVAVNIAYRAGSSAGRTSRAFLIGRGSADSEKLGPLRTDGGAREYRGVMARPLPGGVRR